jgi:DNA-binding FadR family transcriptional regulator
MRSLSSRGIVVIKQGSGTYLSNLPGIAADPLGLSFKYDKKKVFTDLLELRLIMEPSIAAQCARSASDEDIEEIVALAEQISRRIHKHQSHIDYDVAFHCKIAESTKNDILNVFFPEITKGIQMFTELLEDLILEDVSLDHVRIAGAIQERDTQKASNAMLIHLERNRYAIEEQLNDPLSNLQRHSVGGAP